ncbi:MAG: ATP-grasp domain-containing protein [Planctomycetota bacterium]
MNRLVVVGPSVRWLLQSAQRTGMQSAGIDFFADVDATEAGEVVRVGGWAEIPEAAEGLRPDAILIGGGFETQPNLVAALRERAPLWNLSAESCAALRDPERWTAVFAAAGIRVPQHRSAGRGERSKDPPPQEPAKQWLLKRADSSGGQGVRLLDSKAVADWIAQEGNAAGSEFLQELKRGLASSALFFLTRGQASCLGFFRQLCGRREFGAKDYQYCGAIGPLPISASQADQLEAIGRGLVELGGRGVIGIDLMAIGDELCPIEINPRITASGELWELATPRGSLVGLQATEFAEGAGWPVARAATSPFCSGSIGSSATCEASGSSNATVFGKAVLFWPEDRPLMIDLTQSEWLRRERAAGRLADIPPMGNVIARGEPVVTLLATGFSEAAVERSLIARAGGLRANLKG